MLAELRSREDGPQTNWEVELPLIPVFRFGQKVAV
jgi:hypothetical protein